MFGFGRRKRGRQESVVRQGTAQTFVEATGGDWGEAPDVVAADGGSHADYVSDMLSRAKEQALRDNVPIGQIFEFTLVDIPRGISSPHELVFGLMMRAGDHGLACDLVQDERVTFTRTS